MNSPSRPHFLPTKFKRKSMLTSSFNRPGNSFSTLVLHMLKEITFAFGTSIPNHIRKLHYRANEKILKPLESVSTKFEF